MLYPNHLKNRNFGLAKASGFDDCKSIHISNIDPFAIVESRELSLKPKSDFSGGLGIELQYDRTRGQVHISSSRMIQLEL